MGNQYLYFTIELTNTLSQSMIIPLSYCNYFLGWWYDYGSPPKIPESPRGTDGVRLNGLVCNAGG